MPQHRRSSAVPRDYCSCQPSTALRPVVEHGTVRKDGGDRRLCYASSARECGSRKAKRPSRASRGRVRSLARELDSAISIHFVANIPRQSLSPVHTVVAMDRTTSPRPRRSGRDESMPPNARPFDVAVEADGFSSHTLELVLRAANEDMAMLVPNARFFIANDSGHDLHQDQPALVTEAIRQVVTGVRSPDTWYDLASCCAKWPLHEGWRG
jgi:pimeloyl-ACP methyl ester carboxylesterase